MRALLIAGVLALAALAPMPSGQAYGQTRSGLDHPSGAYELDREHASVIWRVSHLGLSHFTGRFNTVNATLRLDAEQPENSALTVAIDARSLDTGNAIITGRGGFDETIANQVLGADAHPEIRFRSTRIIGLHDSSGEVEGELTFNGVTRPVTLNVTLNGGRFVWLTQRYTLGFSASTTINRSDFGADAWSFAVGDVVEIMIEAEFHRT
jgi:polyisoprenoid-binding protein YceI